MTTTDTPTPTAETMATVHMLRATAARCLEAADTLDPPADRDCFPLGEVAAIGLLRDLDARPMSVQWEIAVAGRHVLLTWTSYAIAGDRWSTWTKVGGDDESLYCPATTAAEAVNLIAAAIEALGGAS